MGHAGSHTTNGGGHAAVAIHAGPVVRRLTPTECARLQGFEDDHCQIQYRGRRAADGPQYKGYGNSMAVPVVAWILNRIRAEISEVEKAVIEPRALFENTQ